MLIPDPMRQGSFGRAFPQTDVVAFPIGDVKLAICVNRSKCGAPMKAYNTSLPRAMLGVVAGTMTGAVLVVLWSLLGMTWFDEHWPRHAITIFTYAASLWAGGLISVATIPWLVLHHYGLRSWLIAIVLGAILTFLVVFGFLTNGFGAYVAESGLSAADNGGPTWMDGRLTPHGWFEAFQFSAICSAVGAAVGLIVWRVAYRKEFIRA